MTLASLVHLQNAYSLPRTDRSVGPSSCGHQNRQPSRIIPGRGVGARMVPERPFGRSPFGRGGAARTLWVRPKKWARPTGRQAVWGDEKGPPMYGRAHSSCRQRPIRCDPPMPARPQKLTGGSSKLVELRREHPLDPRGARSEVGLGREIKLAALQHPRDAGSGFSQRVLHHRVKIG